MPTWSQCGTTCFWWKIKYLDKHRKRVVEKLRGNYSLFRRNETTRVAHMVLACYNDCSSPLCCSSSQHGCMWCTTSGVDRRTQCLQLQNLIYSQISSAAPSHAAGVRTVKGEIKPLAFAWRYCSWKWVLDSSIHRSKWWYIQMDRCHHPQIHFHFTSCTANPFTTFMSWLGENWRWSQTSVVDSGVTMNNLDDDEVEAYRILWKWIHY